LKKKNSELSDHVSVRLDQNAQFWAKKLKIWPVSLTKKYGSAPGAARKILQRGHKVT